MESSFADPRGLGSDRSFKQTLITLPSCPSGSLVPSLTRGQLFIGLFECSVILGRAIKTEYLALGTLLGTVGLSMSLGGGSKDAKPKTVEQVKESVSLNASSK